MTRHAWIDISVPLRSGMLHWPGDPPVEIRRIADLARGDACTVSALSLPAHIGTHLDAPLHYLAGGCGIDEMPPETTLGAARVLEIKDRAGIRADELRKHAIRRGERILFRTRNTAGSWWRKPFDPGFVALTRDAAAHLAERQVRCVGIDALSIGSPTDEGAEVHRLLLEAGVWILEGLDLSKAPAGRYELICLPLRIVDADGAPARALLRRR